MVRARWDRLKSLRVPYERDWNDIVEFIAPSRTDMLREEPGALRSRRLVDTQGRDAAARLAAMLHGHMVNPVSPWVIPKPTGQVSSAALTVFLDGAGKRIHTHLLSPESGFAAAFAEFAQDLIWFGTGVVWLGSLNDRRPFYMAVPLFNCWIDQDVRGQVDTVYRTYKMRAAEAASAWPKNKGLQEKAGQAPDEMITLLHAVERRYVPDDDTANGKRKFRDVIMWPDGPEGARLLEQSGHDYLPYAVARFARRSGEVYGYGPSSSALPDVKLANRVSETIMRAAELNADPPTMMPIGFLLGNVDRRPGAMNFYNPQNTALMRGDPVSNLIRGGDAQIGVSYLSMVHEKIDRAFFVDWMKLPEGIAETATAVMDRRSLRTAGLAHMVSRLEAEALEPIARHAFTGLADADLLDDLYEALPEDQDEAEIAFTYRSPLHTEMMAGDVEALSRFLAFIQQVAGVEPSVLKQVRWPETTAYMAERFGVPASLLHDPKKAEAAAREDANAQAGAEAMGNLQTGAMAAQAGAQAAATLGLVSPEAMAA